MFLRHCFSFLIILLLLWTCTLAIILPKNNGLHGLRVSLVDSRIEQAKVVVQNYWDLEAGFFCFSKLAIVPLW